MSYKDKATANRDALFGSAGGSQKKVGDSRKASKAELFAGAAKGSKPSSKTREKNAGSTSKGYKYGGAKKKETISVGLTGEAKAKKMKEAEEFREKAKKSMQKGLFAKPDPLAASSYYKRAADAYQQCGEMRLERLYRINSADCQTKVGAWATAAAEYTRAAALVKIAPDETLEMKREIGRKLYLSAADSWRNMNEPGKAAASSVEAALALIWEEESSFLPRMALEAFEEAVEFHVPDPLNPYARYRQTGMSAYCDPDSEDEPNNPSPEVLDLAKQHLVSLPYAHESVQEVVNVLVSFGEYASALYAAGAVSALLSQDGVSTLTLSRAFVAETIITLAMGDPIAAEENFLNRHVQKSSYLTSRECKLAEELFRALKMRDGDALEEARAVKGSNRAALNNLNESLRELVAMLQLNGVARRGIPEKTVAATSKKSKKGSRKTKKKEPKPSLAEVAAQKTGYEKNADDGDVIDAVALKDELNALDFGDEESDLDDDDIDLR